MNEKNRCLFSIGSNRDKERNILFAKESLQQLFHTIRFSPEIESKAVDCPAETPSYLNCLGVGYTTKEYADIHAFMKKLEIKAGRTPESKAQCSIPLDIDLLQWNNRILKPEDLNRPYIRECLRELSL